MVTMKELPIVRLSTNLAHNLAILCSKSTSG
jgi:hypothetical protein